MSFKARLDDGREVEFVPYSIVLSVNTSHGRRKLHTFLTEFDINTGDHVSPWTLATPASRKQVRAESRLDGRARQMEGNADVGATLAYVRAVTGRKPRRQTGIGLWDGLTGSIRLARGVDVPGSALAIVLDALHSDERRELDLDDVKVIVSQLGSRLTQLDSLDDSQRRHATPTLYSEILRRCTSL